MIKSIVGRNLRKILFFFNILLAGLGAWMVFDVVSFWVSPQVGGREAAIHPVSQVASKQGILVAPRSLKDYELLSTADIFRISPRTPSSQGTARAEGPKTTSLDLKLKGTILGNNSQSYAVIEDGKTKTQLLFSLNEMVHGAQIVAIEPDHVVLSAHGKNEVLMMSEEGEPEALSVSPPPRRLSPGARGGRGNRESLPPAANPKSPGRRTVLQRDQDSVPTHDQESAPGGEQPEEDGSQSDGLTQEKPEDSPSK
jgi:type II secretion system protein C